MLTSNITELDALNVYRCERLYGPFASRVRKHFGIRRYYTKSSMIKAINRVGYSRGLTSTGDALLRGASYLRNNARRGVAKVLKI